MFAQTPRRTRRNAPGGRRRPCTAACSLQQQQQQQHCPSGSRASSIFHRRCVADGQGREGPAMDASPYAPHVVGKGQARPAETVHRRWSGWTSNPFSFISVPGGVCNVPQGRPGVASCLAVLTVTHTPHFARGRIERRQTAQRHSRCWAIGKLRGSERT